MGFCQCQNAAELLRVSLPVASSPNSWYSLQKYVQLSYAGTRRSLLCWRADKCGDGGLVTVTRKLIRTSTHPQTPETCRLGRDAQMWTIRFPSQARLVKENPKPAMPDTLLQATATWILHDIVVGIDVIAKASILQDRTKCKSSATVATLHHGIRGIFGRVFVTLNCYALVLWWLEVAVQGSYLSNIWRSIWRPSCSCSRRWHQELCNCRSSFSYEDTQPLQGVSQILSRTQIRRNQQKTAQTMSFPVSKTASKTSPRQPSKRVSTSYPRRNAFLIHKSAEQAGDCRIEACLPMILAYGRAVSSTSFKLGTLLCETPVTQDSKVLGTTKKNSQKGLLSVCQALPDSSNGPAI